MLGGELIVPAGQEIATPASFAGSPQSERRFWEFFTAEIPNDNTRKAYFRAIGRFDAWRTARNLNLLRLQPILIAAYVKELQIWKKYSICAVGDADNSRAACASRFEHPLLPGPPFRPSANSCTV